MGKANASHKKAGQKHAAWPRVKTGHRFDEKGMSFQALAHRLGRFPGSQHTIKALPRLGTDPKC